MFYDSISVRVLFSTNIHFVCVVSGSSENSEVQKRSVVVCDNWHVKLKSQFRHFLLDQTCAETRSEKIIGKYYY
jgi:hypothetical protein